MIRRIAIVAAVAAGLAACRSEPGGGTPAPSPTTGIARVTLVHGGVTVRRSGFPDWRTATTDMWLGARDQLATGADGTAQLAYVDGTLIDIRSGSLLVLEPAQTSAAAGGEIEVTTFEKPHSIRHSASDVNVRVDPKSRVDVRSRDDQTTVRMAEGSGSVQQQKGTPVPVTAGEGISASKAGLAAKFTILAAPALISPADGAETSYPDPARSQTTLHWDTVAGAAVYRLQVADEATFGQPAVDLQNRKESTAPVPGLLGTYYWRVQAVDADGHEGRWSASNHFTVAKRATPTTTVAPGTVPLRIDELQVKGNVVLIHGATLPGVSIVIDDQPATVDENGLFHEHVAVAETGSHVLVVRATGKNGASAEVRRTIEITP